MYALHYTHPGPSFLQDPPGAVGSFSAPGDQVNRLGHGRTEECSVFACFFCWGSYWRKPLVNTGRTCKLHTERPGVSLTYPQGPTAPHAGIKPSVLAVRRQCKHLSHRATHEMFVQTNRTFTLDLTICFINVWAD